MGAKIKEEVRKRRGRPGPSRFNLYPKLILLLGILAFFGAMGVSPRMAPVLSVGVIGATLLVFYLLKRHIPKREEGRKVDPTETLLQSEAKGIDEHELIAKAGGKSVDFLPKLFEEQEEVEHLETAFPIKRAKEDEQQNLSAEEEVLSHLKLRDFRGYRQVSPPANWHNHQEVEMNEMDQHPLYYGFSENPFKVPHDPKFFFLTEANKEALASIIYGIKERKGFILISGEAGIGKTALIQQLPGNLGEKARALIIDQTDMTIERLLKEILLKLGVPVEDGEKGGLMRQFTASLLQMLGRDENLAILIDGAHHLSRETLEDLRLLSNLETSRLKLLQIVLVGRPEIIDKLNSRDLIQFRQRIVVRSQIRPLTEEESRGYIDHHLKLVESSCSEVFTPEALTLICRYAKGIPRNINIICDHTLRMGFGLSKKRIEASMVKKAQKTCFQTVSQE